MAGLEGETAGSRELLSGEKPKLSDFSFVFMRSWGIHVGTRQVLFLPWEVEGMVAAHILQEKALLDRNQQKQFIDLLQGARRQGRSGCASKASD